jgi:hypothetical protein
MPPEAGKIKDTTGLAVSAGVGIARIASGGPRYGPCNRILSIDGGGIRGIIPALILAQIEKQTEKPIYKLFDVIAGTSTGAILALGLTRPR